MRTLKLNLDEQIDRYWQDLLNVSSGEWARPETVFTTSPRVSTVMAFARRQDPSDGWIVAAPKPPKQAFVQMTRLILGGGNGLEPDAIQHQLSGIGWREVFGPAEIQLCFQPIVTPHPILAIRPLIISDQPVITGFVDSFGPVSWTLEHPHIWVAIFGGFVNQQLVCTCAVRVWGDLLAELYTDTLPEQRNRGFGKAITGYTAQWVRKYTPYIPECVIEASNVASLTMTRSIGFKRYGYLVTAHWPPE